MRGNGKGRGIWTEECPKESAAGKPGAHEQLETNRK